MLVISHCSQCLWIQSSAVSLTSCYQCVVNHCCPLEQLSTRRGSKLGGGGGVGKGGGLGQGVVKQRIAKDRTAENSRER